MKEAKKVYDELVEQGFDAKQIKDAACDGDALKALGISDQSIAEELLEIAKAAR